MKLYPYTKHLLLVATLALVPTAFAIDDDVPLDTIEYAHPADEFTPCGVSSPDGEPEFSITPKEIKLGDVTYVSGGICIGGVQQMKALAKRYPLEIVLVEKTNEKEKEGYIADVKVMITDMKDKLILDVTTEGPYLLVKLPDGKYKVSAEYNQEVKKHIVKVSQNRHERAVFLWKTQSPEE